jgi:hypothetical protein
MIMNTFVELTQAMEGCVEQVKRGKTPDVEEEYVQYENVVGDTFEWVSVIRRQMKCWRESDGALYAKDDLGSLWLVRTPDVESYRAMRGTQFVARSVLNDSPQLKLLEVPSCYHGVEFLRKDLKGRAKVYVYPNGNEGKRKPRRQPKEPIRLAK